MTAQKTPITFKQARALLAELGYTLNRTGQGDELRTAPKTGTRDERGAKAYYTDDAADALATVMFAVDRWAANQIPLPFEPPAEPGKSDIAARKAAKGRELVP